MALSRVIDKLHTLCSSVEEAFLLPLLTFALFVFSNLFFLKNEFLLPLFLHVPDVFLIGTDDFV